MLFIWLRGPWCGRLPQKKLWRMGYEPLAIGHFALRIPPCVKLLLSMYLLFCVYASLHILMPRLLITEPIHAHWTPRLEPIKAQIFSVDLLLQGVCPQKNEGYVIIVA